jgi:D-3-phosphoglycerate dehydrogenase / 2-oxoglutarate reductase
MDTQKILTIGDQFLLPGIMRNSIAHLVPTGLEFVEASTPFPHVPVGNIAEVREASGSEAEMIEHLQGVSLCVAHHAPFTRRVIENSEDLRLIVICRGGPVNVNIEAATERSIPVCYAPGRNAAATAEHTVAMMLAALRGIPNADAAMRIGEWKGDYTFASAPFELETATVGLVGYGAIGKIVARILRAFGATVLTYDPYANLAAAENVEQVSLDTLLERSNIVSLHARETPESRGMIGEPQIARMQPGSILVNCARGSLLDYNALYRALISGHLSAAAADVFAEEPLPANSPLLKLPNFVMTPHIAGGTKQAALKAADIAAGEVVRYLQQEPFHFCANPEVLRQLAPR